MFVLADEETIRKEKEAMAYKDEKESIVTKVKRVSDYIVANGL